MAEYQCKYPYISFIQSRPRNTPLRTQLGLRLLVLLSTHSPLVRHHKLGRFLLQEQRLAITERDQAWQPPFGTKTALLVTAEWNPGVKFKVCVDPDRACLDLLRQTIGTVHVPGPYRGSKTHVGVVGFLDRFLFGLERDEWYNGTWRDCQYLYFFQSPTPPIGDLPNGSSVTMRESSFGLSMIVGVMK